MDEPTGLQAPPKTQVFLSYSRKDADFRARLAAALEDRGYAAIYDQSNRLHDDPDLRLTAQDEWWTTLKAMIAASDVMVFIVSPDSAESPVCDDEIAHARALGKRVIAILRRTVDFNVVPERLRALNVKIDFRDNAEPAFAAALDALCAELDLDIEWHRIGARLMRQADLWDRSGRPEAQLLRSGAIADADAWAARRSKNAPPPGELLLAFLDASRSKEAQDARQLREITARAFIGPVAEAVASGRSDHAVRLTAAAVILSGDEQLELVPELWDAFVPAAHGLRLLSSFDAADQTGQSNTEWTRDFVLFDHNVPTIARFLDAARILTSSLLGPARIWSAETGQCLHVLAERAPDLFSVAASLDGRLIATSGVGQPIRVWDVSSGSLVCASHQNLSSRALAFTPDGAAVWGHRGACDARTGRTILRAEAPLEDSWSIAVSPDSSFVAIAGKRPQEGQTSNVCLFNGKSGQTLATLATPCELAPHLVFSSDGASLLITSESPDSPRSTWFEKLSTQIVKVPSGEMLINLKHEEAVTWAEFARDGLSIATLDYDQTARIWESASGRLLVERRANGLSLSPPGLMLRALALRPDGALAIGPERDGAAAIWETAQGKKLATLSIEGSEAPIVAADWSSDGKRALIVDGKGRAQIWDTRPSDEIARFSDHADAVASISLSADGRYLATWGKDHALIVRDLEANRVVLVKRLLGDHSCALSPDGSAVIAFSRFDWDPDHPGPYNQTTSAWKVSDGELLEQIEGEIDPERRRWPEWPGEHYASEVHRLRVATLTSTLRFPEYMRERLMQFRRVAGLSAYNLAGAVDATGRYGVLRSTDGPVIVRNDGRRLYSPNLGDHAGVDAALSANADRLALGLSSGETVVFDVSRAKLLDEDPVVILAALLANGVGQLSQLEQELPLLQTIERDLCQALNARARSDQRSDMNVLATALRNPSPDACYAAPPRKFIGRTNWAPAIEMRRLRLIRDHVRDNTKLGREALRYFHRTLDEVTQAALTQAVSEQNSSTDEIREIMWNAADLVLQLNPISTYEVVEDDDGQQADDPSGDSEDAAQPTSGSSGPVYVFETATSFPEGIIEEIHTLLNGASVASSSIEAFPIWLVDNDPKLTIKRYPHQWISIDEITQTCTEYLGKPFRSKEFDRFLCRALIACEMYAFGQKLYDPITSPLKRRVPAWWWVVLIAGPLGVLGAGGAALAWALSIGLVGSWGHWAGFVIGAVGGLLASFALTVPSELRRQAKEAREWVMLMIAIHDAYRSVPQEGDFSAVTVAEAVESARSQRVVWPAALYALLDDVKSRQLRGTALSR